MITLIHGTNYALVSKRVDNWLSLYKQKNKETDVVYLSLDDLDFRELPNIFSLVSLFQKDRLIVGKRCTKMSKEVRDWFTDNFESIKDDVLIWDSSKFSSNTKLHKKINVQGEVILVDEPSKRDLFNWTKSIFGQHGIEISIENVKKFIERQGADAAAIIKEVEKVDLMSTRTFTENDVDFYTTQTFTASMWDMVGYIEQEDRGAAMSELLNLLETNVDPFYIFNMIIREYRLVYLVKNMISEGYSESQIASKAKLHPFVVQNIRKSKISLNRVVKIYEKLINIDFQVKHSYIDIEMALVLFLKIM